MIARILPAVVRRLHRDRRGSTIVEFAIIAPAMCLLLLGAFDVSHTLYTRAVLQGIVQKTARDSTLEASTDTARQTELDTRVTNQIRAMYATADIRITRRFYRTFSEAAAARAETYTDTNGNGRCDLNEPYEDSNSNQVWDADGGNAGQGGAKDATLYTVVMKFPRMFPITRIVGGSNDATVKAVTVLKNQPYADQNAYSTPIVRNCP